MFQLEKFVEARSNVSFCTSLENLKDFFFFHYDMDLNPETTNAINSIEVCSVSMSWAIRVEQFAMSVLSP